MGGQMGEPLLGESWEEEGARPAAVDVSNMEFNTLFILGLNQDQFTEGKVFIYSSRGVSHVCTFEKKRIHLGLAYLLSYWTDCSGRELLLGTGTKNMTMHRSHRT